MAKKPAPARPKQQPSPAPRTQAKKTLAAAFVPILEDFFGGWKRHAIPAALLVLSAMVLYFRSVSYDYVLDDQIVVHNNTYVKQGVSGWGKLLTTETFEGYFGKQQKLVEGGRYRPLSLMTFALEWQMFAPDTTKLRQKYDKTADYNDTPTKAVRRVHHFVNILLYALSGLLLYRVLFLLFPSRDDEDSPMKLLWSVPFVAALLWILHPTHVEAVANIKGRDEILSFLGAFGALYYVLRWLSNGKASGLWIGALLYFLGVLAKETAITFIAVIPFTMYFFTEAKRADYMKALMPFALMTVLYLCMRFSAVGFFTVGKEITDIMNNPFAGMSFGDKMATIFYTLLVYFKLSFFPHPLTHDYYPYHIPKVSWSDLRALSALLLYAGMAAMAWWGWKKKRVEAYVVLFFLATISITSNIVFPVGTFMNERFIYFSTFAVSLWLAYVAIQQLPSLMGNAAKPVGMAIVALFVAGFAFKTWDRVPAWATAETLNRAAIGVSQNSARANCFMGTAIFESNYIPRIKTDKDRGYVPTTADSIAAYKALDSVKMYIDKALEIHPNYYSALTMRAGVAAELHKKDKDLPKLLEAYLSICKQGRYVDFMTQYTRYLHGRPELHEQLQRYYEQAYDIFKNQKRDDDKAKIVFELAKMLNPGSPFVLSNSTGNVTTPNTNFGTGK